MTEKLKCAPFTYQKILTYRTELFGLSAVWIILFHCNSYVGCIDVPRLPSILAMGNMGVDVFLLLSAIGLHRSMSQNNLIQFYRNRIKRVVFPYLIVAVPYFIWYDFFAEKDGILQFILNISTINYWINAMHPVWYVAFILIAYALYPVLYRMLKIRGVGIALLILAVAVEATLSMLQVPIFMYCERAISRIPIFLLGAMIAEYYGNRKKEASEDSIPTYQCGIALGIFLLGAIIYPVIFLQIPTMWIRYLYGALAVCMVISYGFMRHKNFLVFISRPLKFVGKISFEVYLIHVLLIRIITFYDWWNILPWSQMWYFVIIIITIPLAKLLSLGLGTLSKKGDHYG